MDTFVVCLWIVLASCIGAWTFSLITGDTSRFDPQAVPRSAHHPERRAQ
jgi:hypothetical protein